jgi:hypothetical protein
MSLGDDDSESSHAKQRIGLLGAVMGASVPAAIDMIQCRRCSRVQKWAEVGRQAGREG